MKTIYTYLWAGLTLLIPLTQKAQVLSPIALGRSSNIFSAYSPFGNFVYANDSLDMIVFSHRQDVTIWGGGTVSNGKIRYDISINSGSTFYNDIGPVNNLYNEPARFPQVTGFNPGGGSNGMDSRLVWLGTTMDPFGGANGFVNGFCTPDTLGTTSSTEHYYSAPDNFASAWSLCEGMNGEFWAVAFPYFQDTIQSDTVDLYKGIYNGTTDVIWGLQTRIPLPRYAASGFSSDFIGPEIAFSPDGMTGWVAMLGDLTGGHDSVLSPIFIRTTDGGATWSAPVEADLRNVSWLSDSLKTLWVDSLGNPFSNGRPTTGFEFDIVVDNEGEVHMGVVIGSGAIVVSPQPAYSIYEGLAKCMADVHSTGSQLTFDATYLAPILTLRGTLPDIEIDNFPQASRSQNGSHVFFSWTDTDTCVYGFGFWGNSHPDLRITGIRVSDGFQSHWKRVTDSDGIWGGKMIVPNLAPTMMQVGTAWRFPIVGVTMITNDSFAPCAYYYFANDVNIDENEFLDPATLALAWECNSILEIPELQTVNGLLIYPNPGHEKSVLEFESFSPGTASIDIFDYLGRKTDLAAEVRISDGINRVELNAAGLPPGLYIVRLTMNEKSLFIRWLIE